MQTKIQNKGTVSNAFNPVATALVAGAGFVAQGFSGNSDQLTRLIEEAMSYKGFSMIDIYQPCVSFNKINTHLWYKNRVYDLDQTDHDPSNYEMALKVAHEGMDKIPTGIIFKSETIPFHDRLDVLKNKPLFEYDFAKEEMSGILGRV